MKEIGTFLHQKQREQRIAVEEVDRRIGLPTKYILIPLTLLAVWWLEPGVFSQVSFYAGFGVYVAGTVLLTVLYRYPIQQAFRLALLCVWVEEFYLGMLAAHTGYSPHSLVVVTLVVFSAAPVLKAGLLSITHREYGVIALSGSAIFLGSLGIFEQIHFRHLTFWWAHLSSWGLIVTGYFILDNLMKQREERLIGYEQRGKLVNKLIYAQEEERQRIARELHDETSQSMTALMVHMKTIATMLSLSSPDKEKVQTRLKETRDLAAGMLDALHRIAFDLRPILLDDLGLLPAIRAYARDYKEKVGIDVNLEFDGLDRRLPAGLEIILFRVIQEALTNVIKHARSETVDISLTCRENLIRLIVQDDGQGFDTDRTLMIGSTYRPLGILGMEERVTLADGTFDIESRVGEGTRITVELSIDSKPGVPV